MKKIDRKSLLKMLNQLQYPIEKIEDLPMIDVYHTNNWDHITKHWNEDNLRNENTPIREFYFDLKEMREFLTEYLNFLTFNKAVLTTLYGGRLVGVPYTKDYESCANEMIRFLHLNSMRVNSSAGLLVTKDELMSCIDMISECGFMGITRCFMIVPELGVSIEVHHHMNYLIYTNNFEKQKTVISDILSLQNNVKLYVGT